jgi:TonB family protein
MIPVRLRFAVVAALLAGAGASGPAHPATNPISQTACTREAYLERFTPPVTADKLVADSLLDTPLQRVSHPPLHYPTDLRDSGITGRVVVASVIDPTGAVRAAEVMAATHPGFGEPALQVARASRFAPPTVHGQPTWVFMCNPFAFEIRRQRPPNKR